MPVTLPAQFGPMVGASISVDGDPFDDDAHASPTSVTYKGPIAKRRLSGAIFLQGPAHWDCKWATMTLDDFQSLYTVFNLLLNSPDGPKLTFGVNDPRNAGRWETYTVYMDEPQFEMSELYVRNVSVTFTEAIE